MEQNIKISVVVPAYNAALWLDDCIQSICNQTYKNLEIILINDGSTDNTGNIIDSYIKRDSRIIAIHQENKGLVMSREKGIELATGEFTTFVDADDTIEVDMYERLLRNAIRYDADISHCGVRFCYPDGKKEAHYGSGRLIIQDNFTGLKDLLEGKFVEPALWNKLYRTSLLIDSCLDIGVLNNEDLLRNFKLFERSGKSVYEDFCGYNYMQREGSMSKDQTKKIKTAKHVMRARKLIVDNSREDIYPYAMQTWMSSIVNTINQMTYSTDYDIQLFCLECINMLKGERENIQYLCKRQQILANIILISPKLHRMIYSLYKIIRNR